MERLWESIDGSESEGRPDLASDILETIPHLKS